MKGSVRRLLLIVITMLSLTACRSTVDLEGMRQAWARNSNQDISIAIVGRMPFIKEDTDFMKGVYMALEEVNEAGGVKDRAVKILEMHDDASVMEGTVIAQKLVSDPSIVAVVGHTSTHVTLPASTIYENARMLMLSPIVSNSKLTQRGYKYVFQSIPSDDEIGKEMALYAKEQGYKKILIYYADNEYGRGLANSFENIANENDILIVDRVTHFSDDNEFKRALKKWQALDFEAVFIADSMRTGREFIFRLKEAGIKTKLLGDAGLDVNFIETFGDYAEGAVLATLYNSDDANENLQEFIEKFKGIYGKEPDVWAIQGYEAIKLLTIAIKNAESPVSHDVAEAFRSVEWEGITDFVSFDEEGRIVGKRIFKKAVNNGKFEYLPE